MALAVGECKEEEEGHKGSVNREGYRDSADRGARKELNHRRLTESRAEYSETQRP